MSSQEIQVMTKKEVRHTRRSIKRNPGGDPCLLFLGGMEFSLVVWMNDDDDDVDVTGNDFIFKADER